MSDPVYRKAGRRAFALLEPWELPIQGPPLADYDGTFFSIRNFPQGSHIIVLPYDSATCDGATYGNTKWKGFLQGALFHDPWYLEMLRISGITGIPYAKMRKAGDRIFRELVLHYGGNLCLANVSFLLIRAFGGLYRRANS